MIDQLKNTFDEQRVNNCLSSDNRKCFLIAENETTNKSYIVPLSNVSIDKDKCFVVNNSTEKEISHISIDECFLTQKHGYKGKKCDFIVFSDDAFCFVELKTNTQSRKQARKKVKDAIVQLGATIDYFDDNEIDFIYHTLKAYIVLKNKIYPTDSASIKKRRKDFFDNYEVDLLEENETSL